MFDICCIGHITLDRVVTSGGAMHMAGGTAFYFSHAMRNMAVKYSLVTALASTEMQSVMDLHNLGIKVKALPSRHTVFLRTYMPRTRTNAPNGYCRKRTLLRLPTQKTYKPPCFI